MYEILDHIDSPADIKRLDVDGLRRLCAEIRDYMVRCCAVNPGHLGSSLGAVELIVGLHYVYDTPTDKLVFDVGHLVLNSFLHLRESGIVGLHQRLDKQSIVHLQIGIKSNKTGRRIKLLALLVVTRWHILCNKSA